MKNCLICNKPLIKTSYYRIPKKYCSNGCREKAKFTGKNKMEITCKNCGSLFQAWPSAKRKFCTYSCGTVFMKGEKSPRYKGEKPNCEVCGKKLSVFRVKRCLKHAVELTRHKISGQNHYNYRGKTRSFKGKNNPQWKGGIYPEHLAIRNSTEYKEWRKSVYERDNYTCQSCGKRGGVLNADHIKRFADYPELRFDLSNGQTLCRPCHLIKMRWEMLEQHSRGGAMI